MLQAVESALAEVFADAPLGSQIVPFPEAGATDLEAMGRGFRGRRGRVLMRESVAVSAAGGPAPAADWRPADVTPDLQRVMPREMLDAARDGVALAFGVLPSLFVENAQGPLVREAQRHLGTLTLQPICALVGEECSAKLGGTVTLDVLRPLQLWDAGGRARAFSTLVEGMAKAKEAGLSQGEVDDAWSTLAWE
jgi:hypothetical protein